MSEDTPEVPQFAERVPHPVCGHMKPLFAHRESGPCDFCLSDIEREYLPVREITWDEIRGRRRPLLEATDWVDNNPGRVAREGAEKVAAIQAYRQALFDITENFENPEDVMWPVLPT